MKSLALQEIERLTKKICVEDLREICVEDLS